jgi:RNA polymerase sigma-70 factor, ECF subfamily
LDDAHGRTPESGDSPGADAPHPELARLLTEAGNGDEQAWRTIVDLYARRVYALARSRLGGSGGGGGAGGRKAGRGSSAGPFDQGHDAAEEVTQSVFVTVASKLGAGSYTEQGRFESWLFRVAMNRIRDEVRRLKRHAEPTDPETFAGVADSGAEDASKAEASEADNALRQLRLAMERLSDADREIVELRHHAGMSFKQMADMMNEPLGTLLARHHRALKKLKELMTAGDPSLAPTGDHT